MMMGSHGIVGRGEAEDVSFLFFLLLLVLFFLHPDGTGSQEGRSRPRFQGNSSGTQKCARHKLNRNWLLYVLCMCPSAPALPAVAKGVRVRKTCT